MILFRSQSNARGVNPYLLGVLLGSLLEFGKVGCIDLGDVSHKRIFRIGLLQECNQRSQNWKI